MHHSARVRLAWIVLAGASVVAAVGVALTAWGSREPASPGVRPVSVETVRARSAARYQVSRRYVGRIEAARQSDLGFELGGAVALVLVDEGDRVEAGQMLARLDTERLEARRAELEAAMAAARARAELGRLTDVRVREMVARDAASAQRGDDTRKGLEALRAEVNEVRAALDRVDVDLAKSRMTAPFSGTISRRHVDEGAVLDPGHPVLTLLETEHLEVRVGVTPEAAAALAERTDHSVRVRGRPLAARLHSVLPDRGLRTRTVTVRLALEAPDGDLRHGDLAELEVARSVDVPGLWLPPGALTESARGLWSVYVAAPRPSGGTGDGASTHTLSRRQVELIHAETDRVFVRGLIDDGDRVVSSGIHRLLPEQPVRLARSGEAAR